MGETVPIIIYHAIKNYDITLSLLIEAKNKLPENPQISLTILKVAASFPCNAKVSSFK